MKKTLIIFAVFLAYTTDVFAIEQEKQAFIFEPHKLNYFIVGDPGKREAQVKFQFSIKKEVFKEDFYIVKRKCFPLFVAYTQKSFWDIGKESAPFNESNYNPEVFLDYLLDANIINSFKIKSITLSPYEHESNGLAGLDSRSWNRYYAAFNLELKPAGELEGMRRLLDEIIIYAKVWDIYKNYSDQDDYLKSIGKGNESFLNYAGIGEISISLRNFLFGKFLIFGDNQIDYKTRIFRDSSKNSYEIGFHLNILHTNISLYTQYWYGYGERLLRFADSDEKFRIGVSFPY